MTPVVVKTEADLNNLEPGQDFIVEMPELLDDPEGPVKLLETKEYAEAQRLYALAEKLFESEPEPVPPRIVVGTDPKDPEYVTITSDTDLKAMAGGDIRDGAINIKAGVVRRKLQKTGREGWISIDGERYEYR
jgi:hypothetical protein